MAIAVLSIPERSVPEGARAAVPRWLRVPTCWFAGGALFVWFALWVGAPTRAMLFDPHGAYSGWYWQERQLVLGLVAAALLVPLTLGEAPNGRLVRVLESRPVVWSGTVSYGLYLWHLGLLDRFVDRLNPLTGVVVWHGWLAHVAPPMRLPVFFGVALVLGLGCAALSWYGLERPVNNRIAGKRA